MKISGRDVTCGVFIAVLVGALVVGQIVRQIVRESNEAIIDSQKAELARIEAKLEVYEGNVLIVYNGCEDIKAALGLIEEDKKKGETDG